MAKKSFKPNQELNKYILEIGLNSDFVRDIVEKINATMTEVKSIEAECVKLLKIINVPQKVYSIAFKKNYTNKTWITECTSDTTIINKFHVQQNELLFIEARENIQIESIRKLNRLIFVGEKKAHNAKKEMTMANLRLVVSIAKNIQLRVIHYISLILFKKVILD